VPMCAHGGGNGSDDVATALLAALIHELHLAGFVRLDRIARLADLHLSHLVEPGDPKGLVLVEDRSRAGASEQPDGTGAR